MKRVLWLVGLVGAACDTPGDRAATLPLGDVADALADTAGSDATSGSDTTASDSARPSDTASGDDDQATMCERWHDHRNGLRAGTWTGSAGSCDAGTYLEPGPSHALSQVNFYRALAGLPAVTISQAKSEQAQACALLMHANRTIEHTVPEAWSCWSPAGAAAAGLSNLATTEAVQAVDLYITDQDVENLGHRRWLLSNSLGPIGVGSTSEYSCLHVLSGNGDARQRWTAWPPPGAIPIQALHMASWMDVDAAGWSLQSDYIDLRDGNVDVTDGDGTTLAIDVWSLDEGYGSTFGLGIRPRGWRSAAGETYHVSVSGLAEPIAWSFTVVDCD